MSGKRVEATTAEALRVEVLAPVEAESRALAEEQERLRRLLAEAAAETERITVEHERAVDAATKAGRVPPAPPEVPDVRSLRGRLAVLQADKGGLAERRSRLLGDHREEIEQAWQDARPALAERAAVLAAQVETVRIEVSAWLGLVVDARRAHENTPNRRVVRGGLVDRSPKEVTVLDVLDALASGRDVLAPTPAPQPLKAEREPTAGEQRLVAVNRSLERAAWGYR